jgi:hypothetical protein
MKVATKLFFLFSFFAFFFEANSQENLQENEAIEMEHQPIPKEEIPQKIKELEQSPLIDSIFWANIGHYRSEKIRFSSVTENTIYVDEKGFFYRIDLIDDRENVSVSSIFYAPHIPIEISKNPDTTFAELALLNEHICRCRAKIGYAKIIKNGKNFTCSEENWSEAEKENVFINCYDIENTEKFLERNYNEGVAFREKLKTIPLSVKELTE